MGHGITALDSFAFTGERTKIWHKLGNQLPEGLTAVEAFEQEGIDWGTELVTPTYCYDGQTYQMPEDRKSVV